MPFRLVNSENFIYDELDGPIKGKDNEMLYGSVLAPFAVKSGDRNREDESEKTDNRTVFQRDRDRIIHSAAFRRLMYKTQVFANHAGDHFRTRLTHTLEVAQIARGVCKSLALNEDLAEAIALGHDLGHTPFGHAVEKFFDTKFKKNISEEERKLNKEKLTPLGFEYKAFCHNEQSIRIVEELEQRKENEKGLNLSQEVKEGILKHTKDRSDLTSRLNPDRECSHLEGQIVKQVDTITYICHDLEDAIKAGIIHKNYIENPNFKEEFDSITGVISEWIKEEITFELYKEIFFVRNLIRHFVEDLTNHTFESIRSNGINQLSDVAAVNKMIASLSSNTFSYLEMLKVFAYKHIYKSHTVSLMDFKAKKVVSEMYAAFLKNPKLMPPKWYYKVELAGSDDTEIMKVVCDYISCMTDRFAIDEHDRLFDAKMKLWG